jgi:arsenite methyltransferase
MATTHEDVWAAWLRRRRDGSSEVERAATLARLAPVRDRVLDAAGVAPGDTVLDVGCGDGLIGLAALERGADVIFSDVSEACLDDCRAVAGERARYHRAGATDLGEVAADVVTTRSVLIYVDDKQCAFDEFFRVLRPGGRLSIFEPINAFGAEERRRTLGYDVTGIEELVLRLADSLDREGPGDAMTGFDEYDLFDAAEAAGFSEVTLETVVELRPEPMIQTRDWDVLLASSPNPLALTFGEALRAALDDDEIARLEAKLRPQVEQGLGRMRFARAFLTARKCA